LPLLGDVEHVVARHDPNQDVIRIHDRQSRAIVFAENVERVLLRILHLERSKLFIANFAHLRR
jgi:hypothetical protein